METEVVEHLDCQQTPRTFNVVATKARASARTKDILTDIAILTGAIPSRGSEHGSAVVIDDLRVAEKIVVTKDAMTIIGGEGKQEDIKARSRKFADTKNATGEYGRKRYSERG